MLLYYFKVMSSLWKIKEIKEVLQLSNRIKREALRVTIPPGKIKPPPGLTPLWKRLKRGPLFRVLLVTPPLHFPHSSCYQPLGTTKDTILKKRLHFKLTICPQPRDHKDSSCSKCPFPSVITKSSNHLDHPLSLTFFSTWQWICTSPNLAQSTTPPPAFQTLLSCSLEKSPTSLTSPKLPLNFLVYQEVGSPLRILLPVQPSQVLAMFFSCPVYHWTQRWGMCPCSYLALSVHGSSLNPLAWLLSVGLLSDSTAYCASLLQLSTLLLLKLPYPLMTLVQSSLFLTTAHVIILGDFNIDVESTYIHCLHYKQSI